MTAYWDFPHREWSLRPSPDVRQQFRVWHPATLYFSPALFTLPLAQLTYVKWLTTFNSHTVKNSIERSQYIWPLVNAHGGHFNYPINQFSLDWTQSWAEFWSFLSDWIADLRVARVFADTVSQTYKLYCEQIVLVRFILTDNLKDEQSQVFKLPNGDSIVTR